MRVSGRVDRYCPVCRLSVWLCCLCGCASTSKPFWESEPQRSRERRKSGDLSSGLAKPGSPRSPQAAAAAADARQQSSPAAQRVDALLNEIGLGTPPKSPRLYNRTTL